MSSQEPQRRQLKFHIPPNLIALYANAALITATKYELILDFAQILPIEPNAKVQARVVMSPAHAKILMQTLQRHLEQYELQHGKIDVEAPTTLADQLFKSVQPDEGE